MKKWKKITKPEKIFQKYLNFSTDHTRLHNIEEKAENFSNGFSVKKKEKKNERKKYKNRKNQQKKSKNMRKKSSKIST